MKKVLITGGTGSFGRAAAKKLLEMDEIEKVVIFSRDEWKQWEMRHSDPLFSGPKMRYFLGDVRDKERLQLAFRDVDTVIHAAALKQVPAAEYNPTEFIKTNILGAQNIIEAAIARHVEKVMALSTDKSVNPVNLYGATKLCADKLFIAANSYVGDQEVPLFSIVRYGNVLGSRGSIIPKWKEILKEGKRPLPITHPEMTRFWLTVEQAVDFVIARLREMQGEEIFVPKVPTVKTVDIAEAIAPKYPTTLIGIRDGEKMHELLTSHEESAYTFDAGDHYVLLPPVYNKTLESRIKQHAKELRRVDEGFSYGSNTNPHRLGAAEILRYLG